MLRVAESLLASLAIGLVGCASSSSEAPKTATQRIPFVKPDVRFNSLDGKTRLRALFRKPAGAGPFPAIVLLHGCGGLGRRGKLSSRHQAWMTHLVNAGYATLMIDSATPRGVSGTCSGGPNRKVMYRDRPKDAYAGLQFLQGRSDIHPDKIGLMGWSQGGGVTLLTIERTSAGRPVPPPVHDFKAAVSFYPGMCSARRQSIPFTNVPAGKWSTKIPLIVLHGSADNWTLPIPCQRFIQSASQRSEPVRFRLYPGARHSFDSPNTPNRTITRITLKNGSNPTVGTHPQARRDVLKRVPAFFDRHLKRGP